MTTLYLVTATHPTRADFSIKDHVFQANQSMHNGKWHVYAMNLGCSKDYETAEIAIREMCHDHALTIVRMRKQKEA